MTDPAQLLRELYAADCEWLDAHPVRDTTKLEAAEQRLARAKKAVLKWVERDAAGVQTPDPLERAKEIRERVETLDREREALWQEYLRIFPAGKIDESDMAWARGSSGNGGAVNLAAVDTARMGNEALANAVGGMAALDAGHDPLCMKVIRGPHKECTCGVTPPDSPCVPSSHL